MTVVDYFVTDHMPALFPNNSSRQQMASQHLLPVCCSNSFLVHSAAAVLRCPHSVSHPRNRRTTLHHCHQMQQGGAVKPGKLPPHIKMTPRLQQGSMRNTSPTSSIVYLALCLQLLAKTDKFSREDFYSPCFAAVNRRE